MVEACERRQSASLSDSQSRRKHRLSGRCDLVEGMGMENDLWQLCGKYFIAIISRPNAFFLISEILILNRWHDLLKTFKPRKQTEKPISNHHYIWPENSMKYETLLINFWTKQIFNEEPTTCFWMNEERSPLSNSLDLMETKATLPCQPTAQTETTIHEITEKGTKEQFAFLPTMWSGSPGIFLQCWGKKYVKS